MNKIIIVIAGGLLIWGVFRLFIRWVNKCWEKESKNFKKENWKKKLKRRAEEETRGY